MKKYILIFVLLGLYHCYSSDDNEWLDYTFSIRVSYPYFLSANFSTILIPGNIKSNREPLLFRSSLGIDAAKIGLGIGMFSTYHVSNNMKTLTGLFGMSLTLNYLMTYDKEDAKWASNDVMDRSFLGIEWSIAAGIGLDLGLYYSIDTDKKGRFLFVSGIGLFF